MSYCTSWPVNHRSKQPIILTDSQALGQWTGGLDSRSVAHLDRCVHWPQAAEWIHAEAISSQWDSNMGSGSSSANTTTAANRWEQNSERWLQYATGRKEKRLAGGSVSSTYISIIARLIYPLCCESDCYKCDLTVVETGDSVFVSDLVLVCHLLWQSLFILSQHHN